ncbi:MAG: hypothetical protein IH793_03305, partial [Acidobacteria bacterium]|nr:hypothetical protein [Acidobacteriota bacterium]
MRKLGNVSWFTLAGATGSLLCDPVPIGIPAAILVFRAKGAKPKARRGKVLFINADREYYDGRAQNH